MDESRTLRLMPVQTVLPPSSKRMMALLGIGLFAFGLCLARLQSFLLFHSLVELLSMGVAFSIFILAWSARRYTSNPFLPFLGIAYLIRSGKNAKRIHSLGKIVPKAYG